MKAYYNQEKISSSLRNFFKKFSISKPLLKNLCYIILAMISAESVVTSDFSRKLKDNFSLIHLESIERRFRRFFNSFSSISYSLFETFIKHIISKFCVKLDLGLTIFNLCYYNEINFTLKFNFVLYDVYFFHIMDITYISFLNYV